MDSEDETYNGASKLEADKGYAPPAGIGSHDGSDEEHICIILAVRRRDGEIGIEHVSDYLTTPRAACFSMESTLEAG